jgi:hypothetical protein
MTRSEAKKRSYRRFVVDDQYIHYTFTLPRYGKTDKNIQTGFADFPRIGDGQGDKKGVAP